MGTGKPGNGDGNREPEWIDRHLGKIVWLIAMLCIGGLIGRAMTG